MPRLRCTVREFIEILATYDFVLEAHNGTSHRQYRGVIDGVVRKVTVSGHMSDDILLPTLESMIRQSGLHKSLFRK